MIQKLLLSGLILVLSYSLSNAQYRDSLSVSFEDENLEVILDSISSRTGYFFSYNTNIMPKGSLFTIEKEQIHIEDLLNLLFIGTSLEYTLIEDQIILRKVIRDSEGNKRMTTTITGWVKDAETQEPVFGAHVYINGSTIGTYTDPNGNYELKGLKPGNYQVVFSHVGFRPAAYEINSNQPSAYAINAILNPAINVLEGIEVKSLPLVNEDNWIKYYRKFSEEFIGNSTNSNRCTFVNPEIIEFSYSDSLDTYEAVLKEPLVMENKGLGYKVIFEIDYFRSNIKETRFHVRASFEPMEPDNHRTKKRWKKNRQRSYLGPKFHFLKSLMNDDLKSEGYQVFKTTDLSLVSAYRPVRQKSEIISTDDLGRTYLDFEGYLVVDYLKEYQHPSYNDPVINKPVYGTVVNSGVSSGNLTQRSSVELDDEKVRILKNGQIANPEEIQFYGYWSWERMSELMPIDYDAKSDN
ncbi:MAG TPA: hypothetical protein DHN29_05475 [Cytophagales bacterium]|nr:hypothetical protein [Cytophagales bacterium]